MTSPAPIDIALAETIDTACTAILAGDENGMEVHVAPAVYNCVAEMKIEQHSKRGNPLLLLAHELVADENVPPGEAFVR
jgi:hypothetical protein